MDRQEIIDALWSLARDRESFFTDDDYDDLFRHDHAALMAAIEIIEAMPAIMPKEVEP